MNSSLLKKIEDSYQKNDVNSFGVGDTVSVSNVIREGEKSRIQLFKGIVIAKKGSGTRATFTVRKISEGVGVEKIFPLQSPNVSKIEVIRSGSVRRAKLYFLRDRVGKAALRVKPKNKLQVPVEGAVAEVAEEAAE